MVTIKDIARAAGVSHTTVSRALGGSPQIKRETRERIARIAADMNYAPNFSAKSLVQRRTYTIGLFFSSIAQGTSASFLAEALRGIRQQIGEDYLLSVAGLDMMEQYDSVTPQRYDGILLMSQSDADNGFIYHVRQASLPLVVLNRQLDDPSVATVSASDRDGVAAAVAYAAARGHRRFALIEGRSGFRSTAQRRAGYIDGLIRHGLPLREEWFIPGDYGPESGHAAMLRLLELEERPSVVICSNDDMAIGAMNACYAQGVAIPSGMSLIGFDDIPYARYASPALTTVGRPVAEIARLGAEQLLALMRDPSLAASQLLVKTELMGRDSVADLR